MVKINFEVKKKSLFLWATAFLILAGFVGVYAALGAIPDPGHAISGLQTCADGQILQTSGTSWSCVDASSIGGGLWTEGTGRINNAGLVSIGDISTQGSYATNAGDLLVSDRFEVQGISLMKGSLTLAGDLILQDSETTSAGNIYFARYEKECSQVGFPFGDGVLEFCLDNPYKDTIEVKNADLVVSGDLCLGGVCKSSFSIPSDVKTTSATHHGKFFAGSGNTQYLYNGYEQIDVWIQNNGCSGYHVCDSTEIINWRRAGNNEPLDSCWYNSGVKDCLGWTIDLSTHSGYVWDLDIWKNGPNEMACNNVMPVCCCK